MRAIADFNFWSRSPSCICSFIVIYANITNTFKCDCCLLLFLSP